MSLTVSRRRSRRRRLAALLLAVAAALLAVRLPGLTARLIEHGLSRFFHRQVRVSEVRFQILPLHAEVLGLRVAGDSPEARPFLEVARIVAVPRFLPMLGRRLDLAELRLEQLRIRINANPEGGDDIPQMGGGGGGGFELRIGRLAIVDGHFALDHRRVPVELDLPDFRGRLTRRSELLNGQLSFGPGALRFGDAPSFPFGTDLDLVIRGSTLEVPSGRLWTGQMQLDYRGEVRLARRPTGEFALSGVVDLGELDQHLMRTGFDIKGRGDWDGTLSFEGSKLVIEGDVAGVAGEFDGVPVSRYSSHVLWAEGGVSFSDLSVETLGGSGLLAFEIPPAGQGRRMWGELGGVDAEGLVQMIFDIGAPGFAGRATGPFDVRWQRGRFAELTGRVTAEVEAVADGRTPLAGRIDWRAERGVQFFEHLDLHTPATDTSLTGRVELDKTADLALEADSRDLAQTDREIRGIRRALGAPDAQLAGLTGRGHFAGRWLGTLSEPVFAGRLRAPEFGYLGVVWGEADWTGSVTADSVVSRRLSLVRPGARLELEGRFDTGHWGGEDGIDVEARLSDWPARDFTRAFAWDVALDGPLSGEARVRGRRSEPEGFARIRSGPGRYYGLPYAELEAESLFGGSVTAISRGRARVGDGELRFRGALTDTGAWDGSLEAERVPLEELGLPQTLPLAGPVTGELTLQGTLERPRVVGLVSAELRLAGEEVGVVSGRLRGEGDGAVAVAASSRSAHLRLDLDGRVGAAPPYRAQLALRARAVRLDPYLRASGTGIPESLVLAASGELELEGPLAQRGQLSARASLEELRIEMPDYPMRNSEPVALQLEAGKVRLDSFRMAGPGTDLSVTGGADVSDGSLGLVVEGLADLGFVTTLAPRLRASGSARLATLVRGTLDSPQLQGTLDLEGAAVRLRGVPHGIESLAGSVRFTEAVAEFSELRGTLGGGPVQIDGQASYGPEGIGSLDIEARGRGIALRYPEGLRSRLDAELRIFGDSAQQWVTGNVNVGRAEWSRRYDLTAELLGGAASWEPEPTLSEGVRLDVRVRAPGTLKIDNNLATLYASADLRLQGTVAAPILIGRAEMDRGRVYFQGNTYVIRHGTIDFANTQRTDPIFDVAAETRVRSYRVSLQLNGTLDRIVPSLTSDPPLSAIQILNLLAGADESAVASLTQAQAEQARLAAAGAASLAAGRITEEVGLEAGAERYLGLNRFSIDPSVLKGDFTNPGARLTLGKRIGPDVNVQYSQDLSSDADRQFTMEYNLSDRLSILLTQAEPGGFGFDIRIRQTR